MEMRSATSAVVRGYTLPAPPARHVCSGFGDAERPRVGQVDDGYLTTIPEVREPAIHFASIPPAAQRIASATDLRLLIDEALLGGASSCRRR